MASAAVTLTVCWVLLVLAETESGAAETSALLLTTSFWHVFQACSDRVHTVWPRHNSCCRDGRSTACVGVAAADQQRVLHVSLAAGSGHLATVLWRLEPGPAAACRERSTATDDGDQPCLWRHDSNLRKHCWSCETVPGTRSVTELTYLPPSALRQVVETACVLWTWLSSTSVVARITASSKVVTTTDGSGWNPSWRQALTTDCSISTYSACDLPAISAYTQVTYVLSSGALITYNWPWPKNGGAMAKLPSRTSYKQRSLTDLLQLTTLVY